MHKKVLAGRLEIGNALPMVLIAGPCQMESAIHAFEVAHAISEISAKVGVKFIYKSSFDKANRTNIHGKRGIGMDKALTIFADLKSRFSCPVLTDVHLPEQCKIIAECVDIIQIPAFLCRQTDLLLAAAETGRVINIKKGQFMAPEGIGNAAEKVTAVGNDKVLLTERGVCFGYNNLVNDMRALTIMAKTGFPVIFDATHSVQKPGGLGNASGGEREFIKPLARAAAAVGVAGLFIETHPDPDNAPSDGPCMLPLASLEKLLMEVMTIDKFVKGII